MPKLVVLLGLALALADGVATYLVYGDNTSAAVMQFTSAPCRPPPDGCPN
jgi:hypothetical protein